MSKKFIRPKGKLLHATADYHIRKGEKAVYNQAGYELGCGRTWEFVHISNLGTPPPKPKYKKEKLFDVNQDNKPFKKKKVPKDWDLRRPFMLDKNKVKQYSYH